MIGGLLFGQYTEQPAPTPPQVVAAAVARAPSGAAVRIQGRREIIGIRFEPIPVRGILAFPLAVSLEASVPKDRALAA